MKIADTILELEKQWQDLDKKSLTDNIKNALSEHGIETYTEQLKKLMEITESSYYSTQSWFNMGRENVRIPFLKVCKVASYIDVDLEKLLQKR